MNAQYTQLCQFDQIDTTTTVPQKKAAIKERASVLEHYKQSLSFKLQTFRTFYRREADDYLDSTEELSTLREVDNQLATIKTLWCVVADIYQYIKRLERIIQLKIQIDNAQPSHQQQ